MNKAGRYTTIAAGMLFAGYGAIRLAQDVRTTLQPKKQETYELFVSYPHPDFEGASALPNRIFLRRYSDASVLFDVDIDNEAQIPTAKHIHHSHELTDVLGGELSVITLGRPISSSKGDCR